MAVDKTRLRDAIQGRLNTLFADNASPPASADVWLAVAEEILNELITNLEIRGVQVDTAPTHTSAWGGVPTPMDGGAALKTFALGVAGGPMPAVQSNDGTGRVA